MKQVVKEVPTSNLVEIENMDFGLPMLIVLPSIFSPSPKILQPAALGVSSPLGSEATGWYVIDLRRNTLVLTKDESKREHFLTIQALVQYYLGRGAEVFTFDDLQEYATHLAKVTGE